MSFIEESHIEVDSSIKKHITSAENIIVKRELDDFDIRQTANEFDQDFDQKTIIKVLSHIKSEEENFDLVSHEELNIKREDDVEQSDNRETLTKIIFSIKKHPLTAESITVKEEVGDFDNRETANEVYQDLDQQSTIKCEEEENFIDSPDLVSHEELNIKGEDDVEQSYTQVAAHSAQPNTIDELSTSKPLLYTYRAKNGQITIHKCPDCPFQSKHKRYVKRHSILHKNPDELVWYRCTECPYKTARKQHLNRHAIVHNEAWQFEIFKCAHCVFETKQKRCLKRHLVKRHGQNILNIPPIRCPKPECPYVTHFKRDLNFHTLEHSNHQIFKCTLCPYQTKREKFLTAHQLKHESTDKWYACPECPFKTIHKTNLKGHVRTHDQVEWFRCEHCRYKTYRKCDFEEHALTHIKGQWMQCTSCSFKTQRKYAFRQHLMSHHEGDGPGWHQCPECPYKTPSKSTLVGHAKNHNAADRIGWWQCPECSYRTPQINHLRAHRMLHNDVAEWFRCSDCPYKTNLKPSLMRHVKMHLQTGQDKLT